MAETSWFSYYGDDIDATDEEKYEHLTHDSHDMSEGSCMGCGAARMHELVEPCPNTRCARCGQLHGIIVPHCGHSAPPSPTPETEQ